jgi:hypothetical protein
VKGFESRGLILWMESRPCVIYERKQLVDGSPSFLCRGLWGNGGEKKLYEERNCNARGCVKVVGLDVFSFILFV